MTVLSSQEEIEAFAEQQLLTRLRSRRSRRWTGLVLRNLDALLGVVPFRVRCALQERVALPARTMRGVLASVVPWLQITIVVSLASILVMLLRLGWGFPVAQDPIALPSIRAVVVCGAVVGWVVMIWCNVFRSITYSEARLVQGFCHTNERSEIVAQWIAQAGGLRACDAGFLRNAQVFRVDLHTRLLGDLIANGSAMANPACHPLPTVPRHSSTRFANSRSEGFDAAQRASRAKVLAVLSQGELGKHMEHALIAHSTPPPAGRSNPPRRL